MPHGSRNLAISTNLPKALIITTLVLPILLHIRQRSIGTSGFQDTADVLVLPALITVLRIRPITVVRPQTVNGPVVRWSCRWLRVPELDLEDLALHFGAAGVCNGSGVVA